ncbi:MAG TPA: beta-propeller fold lactonase family protein, partial [Candidatus Polarisedimenticolia bacterium]|nr:beta-propeller fold lactonase family protein [Candidatus Polarisedimenticolia bacterium]
MLPNRGEIKDRSIGCRPLLSLLAAALMTLAPASGSMPRTHVPLVPAADDVVGFLYVNNNGAANSVRAFLVRRDGRIESLPGSPFDTRGRGGTSGSLTFASARPTLARAGAFLYAVNIQGGSLSGFRILETGGLQPVAGSPFRLSSPVPFNPVEMVAAHPSGRLLFSADDTGIIRAMEITATGSLLASGAAEATVAERPEVIAVSPDGAHLAVSSGLQGGRLHLFRIGESGALEPAPGSPMVLAGSEFAGGLVFDPAGGRLFVASESAAAGRIHVFEIQAGDALVEADGSPLALDALPFPDDLEISSDGRLLFAADPFTGRIATLAVGPGGELSETSRFIPDAGADEPAGLALSQDGSVLFTTNFSDRSIAVLQVDPSGALVPA